MLTWLDRPRPIIKVSSEPISILNAGFVNHHVTSHQQARESICPVIEVATSQRTDATLDIVRHIFVMILLVTQRTKQIQQTVATILPLLAKCIDEGTVELAEELVAADDFWCSVFQQTCSTLVSHHKHTA